MNFECRMPKENILSILIKRQSATNSPFGILRFDIRYSAVRCLIQTIETGVLIIKKRGHFGVVSYKKIALYPKCPW